MGTLDGREKRQVLEKGQAHERKGELVEAAQCFARAGAHEDAARVLVALGRFVEAGQTLLVAGGYVRGRTLAPDPARRKLVLKAAICFGRGGETRQAVELYLALGERTRALELLRSVGDHVNAARLEADKSGRLFMGWSDDEDERTAPDHRRDAGKALEAAGKLEAALEAYARQDQPADAARVALALNRPAEAAVFLVSAGKPLEAAALYHKLGGTKRAIDLVAQVTRDHPRYREAALLAVELAVEHGSLSFDLEHMLGRFLSSPPSDDREAQAFFALGDLYERNEMSENARDCYRKLLAARPGHAEAQQRLARLEDAGASASDIERVFAEDQEFTSRTRRPSAPIAKVAEAEGDLPDLPELPPLPPAAAEAVARRNPTGTMAIQSGAILRPTPAAGGAAVARAVTAAPGQWPPSTPVPVLSSPTGTVAVRAPTQNSASINAPIASIPSAPIVTLTEGAVVGGRYRLDKKIGQGGMGAVFKATDLELDEVVAIKFLSAASDEQTLGRFKQEVSLSRQFNHPNIIRLYDLGVWGEHRFISMELLSGRDLSKLLGNGPMDLDKALDYLVQACTALQAVHDKGVIHRDIKPENFFVTDGGVVKVMDFGIAKRRTADKQLTRAGMMAGTPQYMAPEQINDFGNVTHLADLYSMGCIAYQMFTGQVPFDAPELMPILVAHLTKAPVAPRRLNPKIPPGVEQIVLKLLAKRPNERVPSGRELAAELARIRMELPVAR